MLPERVSNPGPLTYESGALQISLRGPACYMTKCDFGRVTSIMVPFVRIVPSEQLVQK